MVFGFKNFSGAAFVAKIGTFTLEFSYGIVEEITGNFTSIAAANAAEIPENYNFDLVSTDQFVNTTKVVVDSKILQKTLVPIITGATPNLFI